jgi:hypothetical protein
MNKENLLTFQYHFSVNLLQMFKGGITVTDLITEELRQEFYENCGLIVNSVAEKLANDKGYYLPTNLTFDEFMYCVGFNENEMRFVSVTKPNDTFLFIDIMGNPIENKEKQEEYEDLEDEKKDDYKYGTMSIMIPITFDIDKALVFFNK